MQLKEEYIVDFQGFKSGYKKYILKELAVMSVKRNKTLHCLIKSPYDFSTLYPEKQQQVKWLSEHYHGLYWESGYISPKAAIALFRDFVRTADILLIKGEERCKFLQQLFPNKTVLDLDEVECPSVKQLPDAHHPNVSTIII